MRRAIPLYTIALALLLSPSSNAAFLSAAPASLPPAVTPENASTAFLPNESESRIGLLVANDPLDKTDPMGLEPVEVDSKVDHLAVRTLFEVLKISETNSDRKGPGLERGKTILTRGKTVTVSDQTAVGKGTPYTGPQTIQPPQHPPDTKGAAFAHNHTNSERRDGTITSPADKRDTADATGKPIYTIARDQQTGAIIVERYRPSDIEANRDQHKDGITETRVGTAEWKKTGN